MKIKIILFIFILMNFCFSVFAIENKILFKVNNEIITSVDILNEIEYLKMNNKNLNKLDREKIFEIGKNSIIREKIKVIELSKYFESFEVEKKFYDLLLSEFIKRLNLKSKEEFKIYIRNKDISMQMVKEKIQIELLWNQLVVNKYSKDIKINKDQIKEEIKKNNFQKEILISEILFTVENQKLEQKFNLIKQEIEKSGFESAALLHSVSSSAGNGGKLGWIKLSSLNKKIKKEIIKTNVGEFTNPILIPGGFLILKIEEERQTKITNNINEELDNLIKEITNKQLNQFSNIYLSKIRKEVQINEY